MYRSIRLEIVHTPGLLDHDAKGEHAGIRLPRLGSHTQLTTIGHWTRNAANNEFFLHVSVISLVAGLDPDKVYAAMLCAWTILFLGFMGTLATWKGSKLCATTHTAHTIVI